MEASPYEHHFDTYSLVQTLADEKAYSSEQAVTLMKAIRLMLAINLDVAKDGLVSKSDTENEAYLFRAACSELRTTLQTARHSEMLKQRSQRAQLQHESDLLNQKVSQDLMTMREELKGMFNDRKLGLEEQKRQVDGRIQALGHKITVDLNSEAKSEVEGLRWILTRRAAMAIVIAACK
jgi:flagellar motility protein MotE (MotC chaperone)